jgi:hypothetical protein
VVWLIHNQSCALLKVTFIPRLLHNEGGVCCKQAATAPETPSADILSFTGSSAECGYKWISFLTKKNPPVPTTDFLFTVHLLVKWTCTQMTAQRRGPERADVGQ